MSQSKLSFDDWLGKNSDIVEREYELLHDEYGDAMNLLSQYKEQKYREYLSNEGQRQSLDCLFKC